MRLAGDEARLLAAYLRRQISWDSGLLARLVARERAIGVYTAPPMNVLAFVAVPAEVRDPSFDRVVGAVQLASALEATGGDLDLDALAALAVPISAMITVQTLPPADGWQLPIHAVAGDLVPAIDAAASEVAARGANLSPTGQRVVAQEVWDRPAWAGLPMRALLAAQRLGILSADSSRVAAATSGSWRRFSTPRGQVFVQAPKTKLDVLMAR
jgi:hypothetical protein